MEYIVLDDRLNYLSNNNILCNINIISYLSNGESCTIVMLLLDLSRPPSIVLTLKNIVLINHQYETIGFDPMQHRHGV